MGVRRRRHVAVVAAAVAALATTAGCADDGPPGTALTPPPASSVPATAPGAGVPTTTPSATVAPDGTDGTDGPDPTGGPGPTTGPRPSDPVSTPPSDPVPTPPATAPPPTGGPDAPRPALPNAAGENEAFNGIGRLDGFGSSCTAWLLDVGEPSGPAYALTNGHCVGLFDSTTTVRDQPADGATVRFGSFVDTPSDAAEVPVDVVRYATMRGTDVAVLELGTTRSAVIGLASYALSGPPADGDAIRVVGVPVDGVPEDEQVLRGDTCTAGPTVRLVELEWVWDAAVASDCLGIVGGSSGSPVFDADDARRVVGIVNTTTIGAGPGATCWLGQPCELSVAGVTRQQDRTYAMPVAAWARCFTPAWDAAADGCPVEPEPLAVDAPRRAVPPGATWAATASGGAGGALVVKAGPAGTTDCRGPSGYGAVPPSGLGDLPLPPVEGVALLCAAELDGRGAPRVDEAGFAVMVVDATPPAGPITLARSSTGDGVRVEPIFAPPELSSFDVKVGPAGAVDCADPAGYSIYRRVPVAVPAADLPATVCVVGEDEAGNKGGPQSFELS